ncbi:uncharacterized protein LAJ45_06633 [Morchella importuna]|uniref:uncharacterized protein n=1 Tax=Morchella importuna TaxID=1174673 RepID=UPI001E8D96B6|nr:uncharacterized protein LAJ45_06633 [Morchella importuna]KAH8149094.1 hypothetical protein LAJ45_06633 [Morchella importuna]
MTLIPTRALTTIIFRDAIVSTSWGGEISEGGDSTMCFLYQIQNMFGPPLVLLGHCYESLVLPSSSRAAAATTTFSVISRSKYSTEETSKSKVQSLHALGSSRRRPQHNILGYLEVRVF